MINRRAFLFLVLALSLCAATVGAPACTPPQREEVGRTLREPGALAPACVVLHLIANDGKADSICATAEDLAPFVGMLLEAKRAEPDAGSSSLAFVVADLPPPRRSVPRRRCASWVPVLRDGGVDGGD